jgi:hypothetical protein
MEFLCETPCPLWFQLLVFSRRDEEKSALKHETSFPRFWKRGYEMLALCTPNLMFPNTGRELTPVDKKFPSSPVVVAS